MLKLENNKRQDLLISTGDKKQPLTFLSWVFAIIYMIFAAIGIVENYSPVPFYDMWSGYLDFFIKISDGDLSAFWAQHNEHRIVLSKLLFWLDIRFFSGSGIFLVILNYLFPFAAFAIFYSYLRESLKNDDSKLAVHVLAPILLILLLSWTQGENFIWAFQSQFFLAQLLPLLSFYLIYKSHQSGKNSLTIFLLACVSGFASIATMANGVIALPLMALLGLFVGLSFGRILFLAFLSAFAIAIYFYGYEAPNVGKNTILERPLDIAEYVLGYLGNPFHCIGDGFSKIIGSLFIANSAFFALKFYKKRQTSSLQLSLIAFIIYVGATALITAVGRIHIGVEQAFSSRYNTPVLMAWSALLIIYANSISCGLKEYFIRYSVILLLVPVIFLPKQLNAVFNSGDRNFDSKISALALEIGVNDKDQLINTYPNSDHLIELSRKPIERNLSIFSNPLIKDVRQLMGSDEKLEFTSECIGDINTITEIGGEENYVKIEGWIFDSSANVVPKIIHILSEKNKIIGYALPGKRREDIKKLVRKEAEFSGFEGYLLKEFKSGKNSVIGIEPNCKIDLKYNSIK